MKCLIALCLTSAVASAQPPLLDSLLATHSYPIELRDGSLRGPGADTIVAEGAAAQFVALGEEHNRLEIPLFVTALFRALQTRAGYHYYAEEQDPVTMRRISRAPIRGNRDSVVALARRYQYGFTFISDQELEMLADLGAISTARADPIWGCDQAFGVTHILDELLALKLPPDARASAMAFRDTAAVKERVRDLSQHIDVISDQASTTAFAALDHAVHPAPGTNAEFLLHSLIVSNRIYRDYIDGNHYANGYGREEYMKSRFLAEYRRAEAIDHAPPRVLMKFGHWHLFRGLGPSNLQTLGDFVSQFAIANGSRSYHIAFWPNNGEAYGTDSTIALFAVHAPRTQWTVVDLRALRPDYAKLTASMSPTQRDNFRRWVFGFDAAVLFGGLQRGTWALNPGVAY